MIIVTGGSGFIGSNLVFGLNKRGFSDILVVDNLEKGIKFRNLIGSKIADYLDKNRFIEKIENGQFVNHPIEAVFHQGACSATTEWNGAYMMENNYEYSKCLFHFCRAQAIPFIYASSAAVYGTGTNFEESFGNETPLNVYGYSKFLFDQYIRQQLPEIKAQTVGLRYFNVYGPREAHKGSMASVTYHLNQQLLETGTVKLFTGSDGYPDGEQRRDFIYVDDVVAIILWFFDHPDSSGIFNVGTGKSQTFNDVANAVIKHHRKGAIDYIAFPEHLKGHYQSFTEASLETLRLAGCTHQFKTVEQGCALYLDWLKES